MIKKLLIGLIILASFTVLSCSSGGGDGDSAATLTENESVAYEALSIIQDEVQSAIQGATNSASSGSMRAVAETRSGTVDGPDGGTVSWTGTVAYNETTGIFSFTGSYTYNNCTVIEEGVTYICTGTETSSFSMNLNDSSMTANATGNVTVSVDGTNVGLVYDIDVIYANDVYTVSGTINGVRVSDTGAA